MGKKLILALMAVVALVAFALPATASAKPRLCETNGAVCDTLVPGVKIHIHNVGHPEIKSGGATLVDCTTATMTGTLNKNNAEEVEATIEAATFAGEEEEGKCKGGLGFGASRVTTSPEKGGTWKGPPWCLTASGTEDKITVRGGACSEASRPLTFVVDTKILVATIKCRYTRTNPIEGTYTTHTSSSEDAVLSVAAGANSEFIKESGEEGSVLCPERASMGLQLTLTTDNSPTFTKLYIENV